MNPRKCENMDDLVDQFKKPNKSVEEINELLFKSTGPVLENAMKMYENWALSYDRDMDAVEYNPSQLLSEELVNFCGNRKDLKILDLAAGTGKLGKLLSAKGFINLDAIDGSPEMLAVAKKLAVYKTLYHIFLGPNRLNIPDNSYDLIASTGSFAPGQVNEDCFEELIRITKKGGHIFILMNMRYFTRGDEYAKTLESRMLELQDEGLWKMVAREPKENYFRDKLGLLFILLKC